MLPPFQNRPADTAGTHDDDPAVASIMRSDTGRMRIGGQDRAAKSLSAQLGGSLLSRLGGACQCEAGCNPRKIIRREMCLCERSEYGVEHRRKRLIDSIIEICGTRSRFTEVTAAGIIQASAAAGSAAVDCKKKHVSSHLGALMTSPRMELTRENGFRSCAL